LHRVILHEGSADRQPEHGATRGVVKANLAGQLVGTQRWHRLQKHQKAPEAGIMIRCVVAALSYDM